MFPNLEAEMARSKITQLQMAEMLQVKEAGKFPG